MKLENCKKDSIDNVIDYFVDDFYEGKCPEEVLGFNFQNFPVRYCGDSDTPSDCNGCFKDAIKQMLSS